MADVTTVGYLLSFDGTIIVDIVGATTLRALDVLQNTATVHLKTFVTPSGVKINYDGISDSDLTPTRISQDILCTSGGIALYGTLVAKLGNYGISVLSPLSGGADLSNAGTILVGVEDITPQKINRTGSIHIRVIIEIVGDWV